MDDCRPNLHLPLLHSCHGNHDPHFHWRHGDSHGDNTRRHRCSWSFQRDIFCKSDTLNYAFSFHTISFSVNCEFNTWWVLSLFYYFTSYPVSMRFTIFISTLSVRANQFSQLMLCRTITQATLSTRLRSFYKRNTKSTTQQSKSSQIRKVICVQMFLGSLTALTSTISWLQFHHL